MDGLKKGRALTPIVFRSGYPQYMVLCSYPSRTVLLFRTIWIKSSGLTVGPNQEFLLLYLTGVIFKLLLIPI